MSKVDLNALVNGLSGKIGNAVLRSRAGRTYMSSRPKGRTSEPTAKEKAHRERFRRAAAYSKAKLTDPIAKAEYEQLAKSRQMTSAFVAALTDYLKFPVIDSMHLDLYTGKINDVIAVTVTDDFKVIGVRVTVMGADGAVIETGNATYAPSTLEWRYTATKAVAALPGTTIKAVATDRPGNETVLEKVM